MNTQPFYYPQQEMQMRRRIKDEDLYESSDDESSEGSSCSESQTESEGSSECQSDTSSSGSESLSESDSEESCSSSEYDSDSCGSVVTKDSSSYESELEVVPKTKKSSTKTDRKASVKTKKESKASALLESESRVDSRKSEKSEKKEALKSEKTEKKGDRTSKKTQKKEPKVEKTQKKETKSEKTQKRESKSEKKESKRHDHDETDESHTEDVHTSTVSPGQYIFGVICNVLQTNDKKAFKGILHRTPVPIALHYFHHIAQIALSTGNKDIEKVIMSTNKKYNIISEVYMDAFKKGDPRMINMVMDYFTKTVNAFKTADSINSEELLKHFTPEFIAMNLIQSGNVASYDDVIGDFKADGIVISRGFHTAKPLIAAYFGVKGFFSNQKRYTFNREVVVLAICGGSVTTLDYIIKKIKGQRVTDDIVLEARSCHPISPSMVNHLKVTYKVSGI